MPVGALCHKILCFGNINRNIGQGLVISERQYRNQIQTKFNADQTQNMLRRQNRWEGEQRDKTVKDLPKTVDLGQVLKDLEFPADSSAIAKFVEQSNKPELHEVLPVIQKLEDRRYQNLAEVAKATRLIQG